MITRAALRRFQVQPPVTARAFASDVTHTPGGDVHHHHGPINPISDPSFPKGHVRVFGECDDIWSHSYKFWANKFTNPPYKPTYIAGGVHDMNIDIERHFSTQDRWETVSYADMAKYYFYGIYATRCIMWPIVCPMLMVSAVALLEMRREPLEIKMDREEYYLDFDSNHWGVYFDHHHFSHKLAKRRCNKWGYEDVTLSEDHH